MRRRQCARLTQRRLFGVVRPSAPPPTAHERVLLQRGRERGELVSELKTPGEFFARAMASPRPRAVLGDVSNGTAPRVSPHKSALARIAARSRQYSASPRSPSVGGSRSALVAELEEAYAALERRESEVREAATIGQALLAENKVRARPQRRFSRPDSAYHLRGKALSRLAEETSTEVRIPPMRSARDGVPPRLTRIGAAACIGPRRGRRISVTTCGGGSAVARRQRRPMLMAGCRWSASSGVPGPRCRSWSMRAAPSWSRLSCMSVSSTGCSTARAPRCAGADVLQCAGNK